MREVALEMHACFHHVKGQVGLAAVEVPGGPKVLPKAHAADHVQSDPQRGIVKISLCSCTALQDADQLLVDLQHMPKAFPAEGYLRRLAFVVLRNLYRKSWDIGFTIQRTSMPPSLRWQEPLAFP